MGIRSWESTLIDMVPPWPEQGGHFYCVKTGHFYCRSTERDLLHYPLPLSPGASSAAPLRLSSERHRIVNVVFLTIPLTTALSRDCHARLVPQYPHCRSNRCPGNVHHPVVFSANLSPENLHRTLRI